MATVTTGVRTEVDSSRIPDVLVCSQPLWNTLCDRRGSGVLDFGETPQLVIEVTSDNWREDYIRKSAEYALIDIPEYWIVDPNKVQVWRLTHPENDYGYDQQTLKPGDLLRSLQFPDLVLPIDQLLNPPLVEDLMRQETTQQDQREQGLRQEAETERQRAETERQRANRLAERLRELSIDPEAE